MGEGENANADKYTCERSPTRFNSSLYSSPARVQGVIVGVYSQISLLLK